MNYPAIFDASYQEALFPYSFGMKITEETACHHQIITQPSCHKTESNNYCLIGERRHLVEISAEHNTRILYTTNDDVLTSSMFNKQIMFDKIYNWIHNVYLTRLEDFVEMSLAPCKMNEVFMNVFQALQLERKTKLIFVDNTYKELETEALEKYGEPITCSNAIKDVLKMTQDVNEELTDINPLPQDKSQKKLNPKRLQSSKKKRRVRLEDLSPRQISRILSPVKRSPSSVRSVKSKEGRLLERTQSPSKLCAGTSKRLIRKERNKRRRKKCTDKERRRGKESLRKCHLINKFTNAVKSFQNCFLASEWKQVHPLLPEEVVSAITNCLQIISQCSKSFLSLITVRNCKLGVSDGEVLQLGENCISLLEQSFTVLTTYVNYHSKITKTRLWDKDFLTNSSSKGSLIHLKDSVMLDEVFVHSVNFCHRNLNNDVLYSLFRQNVFCSSREWKLKLNRGNSWKNSQSIAVHSQQRYFHRTDNKYLKVDYQGNSVSKTVMIVDDSMIWNSTQWEHLDGWVFKEVGIHLNDWLYKFNVNSLEKIISSVSIAIWYDWFVPSSIHDEMKNKTYAGFIPLWSLNGSPKVKVDSLELLVKKQDGNWHFKDITINWQACGSIWKQFQEQIQMQTRYDTNSKLHVYKDMKMISSSEVNLKYLEEGVNSILIGKEEGNTLDECVFDNEEKKPLKCPCFIL